MTTRSEEDLINEAMAILDMSDATTTPKTASGPTSDEFQEWREPTNLSQASAPAAESPTLQGLGAVRRPKAKTVCEGCPNSVWFASTAEVKCYCRVMFLITWSNKDPQTLTACDGLFIGREA